MRSSEIVDKARVCDWAVEKEGGAESFREGREGDKMESIGGEDKSDPMSSRATGSHGYQRRTVE